MSEGWQGFSGQNSFLEFGKKPFVPGETGGIHGEVIYASTRPFDDPALLDPHQLDPGRAGGDDQPVPGRHRGRWQRPP